MTTTLPALVFALVLALLCGAIYHLIRGGSGWYLLLYFLLSIAGFAAGQGVSIWRGWLLLQFGMLDIGMGVIGSIIFLVMGDWLSRIEMKNNDEGDKSGV